MMLEKWYYHPMAYHHPALKQQIQQPAQRPIIDWYFSSNFWMKSFALAASAAFSTSACCGTSPAVPLFLLQQGARRRTTSYQNKHVTDTY